MHPSSEASDDAIPLQETQKLPVGILGTRTAQTQAFDAIRLSFGNNAFGDRYRIGSSVADRTVNLRIEILFGFQLGAQC